MKNNTNELLKTSDSTWDDVEERVNTNIADQAVVKAEAFLKKHRREIKRLKDHIQDAIFELDLDKYEYAINKLKGFYRQPPLSREEAKESFERTVANVAEIIKSNS